VDKRVFSGRPSSCGKKLGGMVASVPGRRLQRFPFASFRQTCPRPIASVRRLAAGKSRPELVPQGHVAIVMDGQRALAQGREDWDRGPRPQMGRGVPCWT